MCYDEIIHPVPDLSMVEIIEQDVDVVQPPPLKRLPGRPRKNRRLEEGESMTQVVGKRSTTVKCSNCQ